MAKANDGNDKKGKRGWQSQSYIILNKTVLKLIWCKKVTSYFFSQSKISSVQHNWIEACHN